MSDEAALIAALQQRDQRAFTQVFTHHADKIYRLAMGILQDEQQADGVVQETFLALITHIDTFEARSHIGTWLYRVAYNEAVGRVRRHRPTVSIEEWQDDDFMPTHFVDWQNIPDTLLTGDEAREQMAAAIQQLSPSLRAVFILRDVEELSTAETAAVLNISESAVKVRLHRARLALRESLAQYFEEYVRS